VVTDIFIGRYQHYKGNLYQVLGLAKHSETLEEYVVYQALYGEKQLWIRPKDMFLESVEVDGKLVPRFQYLGE
jgi:cyclomaltodextrinase